MSLLKFQSNVSFFCFSFLFRVMHYGKDVGHSESFSSEAKPFFTQPSESAYGRIYPYSPDGGGDLGNESEDRLGHYGGKKHLVFPYVYSGPKK